MKLDIEIHFHQPLFRWLADIILLCKEYQKNHSLKNDKQSSLHKKATFSHFKIRLSFCLLFLKNYSLMRYKFLVIGSLKPADDSDWTPWQP